VLPVDVSAATGTPAGHQQLLKQLAAAQTASKLGGCTAKQPELV
jgi:hypothetical protein